MKLHISYNVPDLEQALELARKTAHVADALYLGTLLLISHGKEAVMRFREEFPNKYIALDTKITDHWSANLSFLTQFNIEQISVLAGAQNAIIQQLSNAAHKKNIKVALDLIVTQAADQAVSEAQALDIDAVIYRNRAKSPEEISLEEWGMIQGNTKLPIFIEGNITFELLETIKTMAPTGIIVGSLITTADDPGQTAEKIKALISNNDDALNN